jgi:hypothetical protein
MTQCSQVAYEALRQMMIPCPMNMQVATEITDRLLGCQRMYILYHTGMVQVKRGEKWAH